MKLTHFPSLILFALFVSAVMACLGRTSRGQLVRKTFWYFFLFLAVSIGLAWLMFPFSR